MDMRIQLLFVCVASICLTTALFYRFQPVPVWNVHPYEASCPIHPGSGMFSIPSLNSTALASFPGSGNTWTRHLLTAATVGTDSSIPIHYKTADGADNGFQYFSDWTGANPGFLTGSVYFNEVQSVFASDSLKRHLIVIKTHYTPQETLKHMPLDQGVLVIRNPYEALLAEFNRQKKHNASARAASKDDPRYFQKAVRPPGDFKKVWPNYLQDTHVKWGHLNLAWATSKVPLHVLVYHRLQSNLELELRQVLAFLNQSHSPLVHCAIRDSEGNAHRKKEKWQEEAAEFTAEHKRRLNADIGLVQKALERKTGHRFDDFQMWKRS